MTTLGEQIIAARKKNQLTQDQLAARMNVSRSAVANWETDRRTPDAETLLRLSQVLEYSFEAQYAVPPEGPSPEPEAQAEPPREGSPAEEPPADGLPVEEPTKGRKLYRRLACFAVGAALFCLGLALGLLLRSWPGPALKTAFPAALFAESSPDEAGRACLFFENKTWQDGGEHQVYDRYTFTAYEKNGVGFRVSRIEIQAENAEGGVRVENYGAGDLKAAGLSTEIPPYGDIAFSGGFPAGGYTRVGITVYGSDASGEGLFFRSMTDFKK